MPEYIYRVFVDYENPDKSGITKIAIESYGGLYRLEKTISIVGDIDICFVSPARMNKTETWGPEESRHQYLTFDEDKAVEMFCIYSQEACRLWTERKRTAQNKYEVFLRQAKYNYEKFSSLETKIADKIKKEVKQDEQENV